IDVHVMPPSVDLKTPPPGSHGYRLFGSPVPAQTICVSEGAIASTPTDATRLSSNRGRQVMPLFMDFQIPPAAAAMKNVFEGDGIPTTSERRPLLSAGPIDRQRKPATVSESSAWASAAPPGAAA